MSDSNNIYQLVIEYCQERVKFTKAQFDCAKFHDKCLPIKCKCCGEIYYVSKQDLYKTINYRDYKTNLTKLDVCSFQCKHSLKTVTGNCVVCNKPVVKYLSDYCGKLFCSRSCAVTYNNTHKPRKQKKPIKRWVPKTKQYCSVCGSLVGKCPRPEVCRSGLVKQRSNNLALLGFDLSSIGSLRVIQQFDKVKMLLHRLYYDELHSICTIKKLYNIPSERTFVSLFRTFDIKVRNESQRRFVSYTQNRMKVPLTSKSIYKHGYHTTWEGKDIYYRSSYQLQYCHQLDQKKISYDVQCLRIPYFDTVKKCYRVAIPDFYLKNENKLVEIKSKYTYNYQNMVDKRIAYLASGYQFELILEHQSYGNECPQI